MARPAPTGPVLDVRGLSVGFADGRAIVPAVHDVGFSLAAGETLALVGESGSGKSVTSLAAMRLLPPAPRTRVTGSALLRCRDGAVRDLLALPDAAMRRLRGDEIAMIFQEPMTSLNPVHRIGDQIAEGLRFHRGLHRRDALKRAEGLIERVGIPDAARRLRAYPHELSGGMRQRVMIAMALGCDPAVLIADEPTTALDVTVQAQILDLLKGLQRETGMGLVFITHNLGVVAEIADRVMVMYAGRIVERGGVVPVMTEPLMPYTRGLIASVPRLDLRGGDMVSIPGTVPDPRAPPPGCAFAPRCSHALPDPCDAAMPALDEARAGHLVRCRRWDAIAAGDARGAPVPEVVS
ncbi:ABC transporter ATP-binding protein [Lichenibacterium minor]|uniref:ABC transporter ATP-binding protein n=1 Tax=Lichenibacterium minor TaxID=2316528 RepID=A0A4Q2U0H9_9HYPH|nr:ABC transporter ATP-binding protein [Lichenibacterium minor]RYC29929.1 ABC transporter ATP-binding protein [Lichenibacterium minor]